MGLTRALAALAAACALAAPAHAEGFLHGLVRGAQQRLDAQIAARAPALVPPVPIAVHWKAQKLGAIDLGAPLAAFVAADLDGDGKAELYAVTPREVIALGAHGPTVHELGRVAFGGELAAPASRDPVGAAVIDGDALVAAVSTWQRGLRVRWRDKTLTASADPTAGFPLCTGRAQLVAGRNYYTDDTYAARCRDVIDAHGARVHVTATLATTGKLTVAVGADKREYAGVGTAFDIADIDRDGTPEVIYSGAGAPGDADAVKVVGFGGDDRKPVFRKSFNGGVAGVVAADLDGDGALEVVVVVRLLGSTKVDVWRLD